MVHLLLTGPTGFCGREVLRLALRSPLITSILVITRRRLPDELGSRKLRTLIHKDFSDLTPLKSIIAEFKPDACIWCIGGPRKNFKSLEEFEKVTVEYPVGAARLLAEICAGDEGNDDGDGDCNEVGEGGSKFRRRNLRFVYLSGWGADVTTTSTSSGIFGRKGLKLRVGDSLEMAIKGRAEKDLFRLSRGIDVPIGTEATKQPGENRASTKPSPTFELYTFRPGDPPLSPSSSSSSSPSRSPSPSFRAPSPQDGKGKHAQSANSSTGGGGGGGGGSPQQKKTTPTTMKEKLKSWIQPTCPNELLAAAMIGVAIKGFGEAGISVFFENREIVIVGKEWVGRLGLGMDGMSGN